MGIAVAGTSCPTSTAAYQLYRSLVAEFRDHHEQDYRRESLRAQILEYKRRCELMRDATNIGTISAIVLISALIAGVLGTLYDQAAFWKYLTAACAISGLLLVIWAATLVILENMRLKRLIDMDISDLPELAATASHHQARSYRIRQKTDHGGST